MNDWPNVVPPPPRMDLSNHTTHVKNIDGGEKNTPVFSGGSLPVVPDNTGNKQVGTLFQPGVSGNPNGRPKGSRNKFTELFMKTLVEDFTASGADSLKKLREKDPEVYFRLIISLIPKSLVQKYEQSFSVDIDFNSITPEQLAQLVDDIQRQKFIEKTIETITR